MKLPSFRRVLATDFKPEDQDLVRKLSDSSNINVETLYTALNKRLTLTDNLACTVRTFTIVVDSSGTPVGSTTLSLDSTAAILGTQVIQALNQDNNAVFPTSQPFASFELTQQGRLRITNMTGLQAGATYLVTLVVYNA